MLGFIVTNPEVPSTGRSVKTYSQGLTNLFNNGATLEVTMFGTTIGTGTFNGTSWTIDTYVPIPANILPDNVGIINTELDAISKDNEIVVKTTNYTINRMDSGKVIEMTSDIDNNLTIPNDTAIPINAVLMVRQMGIGQTTVVAGVGVTILNPHGTLKLYGRYACAFLQKRSATEWCADGNLAEA